MQRFEGKVVLVTGATGGLGVPICQRLSSEGASIVATDIARAPFEAISAITAETFELDVANETEWEAVVTRAEDKFGKLDVLVNNAGISSLGTVEDEDRDRWDRIIAVDQTGPWLGMKYAGPVIERTGGGAIVNISSILGSTGGLANSIAYHSAKGAVRAMTKNAALYWAKRGIRVNSLHPGFIGTQQLMDRFGGSERHEAMLANTPMGRLGKPEEIAAAVAFMASDEAAFMTGAEVYMDGGWTAR